VKFARLFATLLRPVDSEWQTLAVFESSCHLLLSLPV